MATVPTPLDIMNRAMRLLSEDELSSGSFVVNSFANSVLQGLNIVKADIYHVNPRWGVLEATSTFATVSGTQNYDLSNSGIIVTGSAIPAVEDIREIIISPTTSVSYPLLYLTREEYDLYLATQNTTGTPVVNSGQPTHYFYDNQDVYLYPTPDSAYTMTVKYQLNSDTEITTSTLSSTTIIPFTNGAMNMFVWGVAYMAAISIPDERAPYFENKYKEARMIEELVNYRAPAVLDVDSFFARGML